MPVVTKTTNNRNNVTNINQHCLAHRLIT